MFCITRESIYAVFGPQGSVAPAEIVTRLQSQDSGQQQFKCCIYLKRLSATRSLAVANIADRTAWGLAFLGRPAKVETSVLVLVERKSV